jgi:hypothetical protein
VLPDVAPFRTRNSVGCFDWMLGGFCGQPQRNLAHESGVRCVGPARVLGDLAPELVAAAVDLDRRVGVAPRRISCSVVQVLRRSAGETSVEADGDPAAADEGDAAAVDEEAMAADEEAALVASVGSVDNGAAAVFLLLVLRPRIAALALLPNRQSRAHRRTPREAAVGAAAGPSWRISRQPPSEADTLEVLRRGEVEGAGELGDLEGVRTLAGAVPINARLSGANGCA